MKLDIFLNRIVFRLVAPLLYGSVAYILILLIFDSLSQLNENFFSQEILVTIVLSYLQLEALRGTNSLINRGSERISTSRILLQFGLGILLTIIIVSAGIAVYFVHVVGFSTFNTELITFNAIYVLTSVLYNLIFMSLLFLGKKNEGKINTETLMRKNLEADLESFRNEINPELLFESFESLISLIHQSRKQADEFIGQLSAFYRYCLHNRNNDLVTLSEELKILNILIRILNERYNGQIHIKINVGQEDFFRMIVPCTLLSLIEIGCRTNIINQYQNLEIYIVENAGHLRIAYPSNRRLSMGFDYSSRLAKIEKSYAYFSDRPFDSKIENERQTYTVPLLSFEEEG